MGDEEIVGTPIEQPEEVAEEADKIIEESLKELKITQDDQPRVGQARVF